jgi:hypothetical protein
MWNVELQRPENEYEIALAVSDKFMYGRKGCINSCLRICTKVTWKSVLDITRSAVENLGDLRCTYRHIGVKCEWTKRGTLCTLWKYRLFIPAEHYCQFFNMTVPLFTVRQVTTARNHIAMCSVGGFANSAEFQKPQPAHFLFCHDHLLQTIPVVVAPSHSCPSLFWILKCCYFSDACWSMFCSACTQFAILNLIWSSELNSDDVLIYNAEKQKQIEWDVSMMGNALIWRLWEMCTINVPSKLRGRAVTEMLPCILNLLPRSWNFSIFICKYSYFAYYKKLLKYRAVVRSCKNFLQVRAAVKKIEGTLCTIFLSVNVKQGNCFGKLHPVVNMMLKCILEKNCSRMASEFEQRKLQCSGKLLWPAVQFSCSVVMCFTTLTF